MKHKWRQDEVVLLQRAVDEFGCDWDAIVQKYFQNLSRLALKNKYYQSISQREMLLCNKQNSVSTQDCESIVDKVRDLLKIQ